MALGDGFNGYSCVSRIWVNPMNAYSAISRYPSNGKAFAIIAPDISNVPSTMTLDNFTVPDKE